MRGLSLCVIAMIVVGSSAHAAPGVNMRWTSCFGDGGAFNRNFACNTNTGTNTLVGSFVLGQPVAPVSSNEMVIDLAASSPTLPSWWAFRNSGTCRQSSLSINSVANPSWVACVDWANEMAGIAVATYTIGFHGPATTRVTMVSAPPAPYPSLVAGQEYFSFNLNINNQKTVGTGACAGCTVPICARLASIKLVTPTTPVNDVLLSGPTNGTDSDFVTWQNGAAACLAATPARRETWGAVKSLYR